MKLNVTVFLAASLVVLAVQVIFGMTILQVTMRVEHVSFVWQVINSMLVASIVAAVVAQVRKPRPEGV